MKKYFITGLAILLPLALTIFIVGFIVNFLTKPFMGLVDGLFPGMRTSDSHLFFLPISQLWHYGTQLAILAMLFGFTLFLGYITRWFFFKSVISLGDFIIHRIPLINNIYRTSQDVIKTLFTSQNQSFQQVVLVPFPEKGVYCLGLVTREAPQIVCQIKEKDFISVFVPTTPNPTSGYLLMFAQEDVTLLDMKVEDAIKFIISCGVIHPGQQDPSSPLATLLGDEEPLPPLNP